MTDRDPAPGCRDAIEAAGLAPGAAFAGGLPSAPMLWQVVLWQVRCGFLHRPGAAAT